MKSTMNNGSVLNLFKTDRDTGMSWRTRVNVRNDVFCVAEGQLQVGAGNGLLQRLEQDFVVSDDVQNDTAVVLGVGRAEDKRGRTVT